MLLFLSCHPLHYLHIYPSQVGLCHLWSQLLTYKRHPDEFLLPFDKQLCVFHLFCFLCFFSRHHHDHMSIFAFTVLVAFRLVFISCSEISLCVSSSFSFIKSSITTGDESSRYSSLTSHVATTAGDVILGSVAFLFLYWDVLPLSYYWDDNSSPFFTLCKFISFNLSSIVSTLTLCPSLKNHDEKVGSLSGGEKKI